MLKVFLSVYDYEKRKHVQNKANLHEIKEILGSNDKCLYIPPSNIDNISQEINKQRKRSGYNMDNNDSNDMIEFVSIGRSRSMNNNVNNNIINNNNDGLSDGSDESDNLLFSLSEVNIRDRSGYNRD